MIYDYDNFADTELDMQLRPQITVKKMYLNQLYTMRDTLPDPAMMKLKLAPGQLALLVSEKERAMHELIKLKSLSDHFTQMGWVCVSYKHTAHAVMDISVWVLHHVNGMNMNILHNMCWWFQDANEAAFFRLRWS